MTSRAGLDAWLREDDEVRRPERVERLRVVVEETGPETFRFFPGGPISAWAFEEARQAYIYGLDLACIIIAQVSLEHLLLGLFKMMGRDDLDRAPLRVLLREALSSAILNEHDHDLFQRLRRQRNPYAHPRPLDDGSSLVKRAVSSRTPMDEIVADDARQAVIALIRLTLRPPFSLSSVR